VDAAELDAPAAILCGLSAAEAAVRLTRDGPDELLIARGPSSLRRFAVQFTDLFAVMLLVAAVITLVAYELGRPRDAGNLQLAVAILAVVLLKCGDRVRAGIRGRTYGLGVRPAFPHPAPRRWIPATWCGWARRSPWAPPAPSSSPRRRTPSSAASVA
jgi:hypothetical protein